MVFGSLSFGQDVLSKRELRKQQKSFLLLKRPWTVELPLWIPGFAGSFAYGDIDIEGEDGVDPEHPIEPPPGGDIGKIISRLFSSSDYLKFFFITRIAYERKKIIFQFDAITGAVGSSVKFNYNNREIVQANFRTTNMRLFGGYKILELESNNNKFRYELFGYFGLRAHFHRVYSDLNEGVNKLDIHPHWIEPVIGVHNQFTFKNWLLVFQADYGGLFVNNKYSDQISTYVFYRMGKLTSLKIGWNHLHLNQSGVFFKEEYKIRATFSGPTVGIAFHL